MSGCCPKAPSISTGDSADEDFPSQGTSIHRGESVECYVRRAGNPTGLMDDKTEHIDNKIRNNDIPLNNGVSVNETFRLTPNSTRVATTWEMKDANDNVITNFSGTVTFSSSGVLSGTFGEDYLGKSIKIKITARDAAGEIDTRGFTFSPAKPNTSNEIRFVHPLPGARMTSGFGPRRPPAPGASASHGGLDFSVKPLPPADVLAAADGEVSFVGGFGGGGNCVQIRHLNGAGTHLCTTLYMHLDRFYVQKGQKVVAGQKIALEGSTGVSTSAHLHFECRLPNGSKIDPLPLIKGTVQVAQVTNPDNTGKEGTFETQNSQASLTPENVRAKEAGCEPFGSEYPRDPMATNDPVPVVPPPAPGEPLTDPFEKAWYFTMTWEVGPHWTTSAPSDPEVAQGLCETSAQKKKTGYKVHSKLAGGITKFGIAQEPNPSIVVNSIDYANAKKVGFNNYWKRGPSVISTSKPKTAIMLFDMYFIHGVTGGNGIRANANIGSLSDDQAVEALSAAQKAFMLRSVQANSQRSEHIKGWLRRNAALLAYAKSIT